jgi:hypothetical protein
VSLSRQLRQLLTACCELFAGPGTALIYETNRRTTEAGCVALRSTKRSIQSFPKAATEKRYQSGRDAISAEQIDAWQPTPNSVQSRSLVRARLHRLNFYVVLRKLIAKLQTFSQSIQETTMV